MKAFFLVLILFSPQLCIAFNSTEDDLVFVDDGDELSSLTKSDSVEVQHEDYYREQRHKDHQRYWENNLPIKKKFSKIGEGLNRNVSVGHVFKLKFVKHAFGQSIQRYEVLLCYVIYLKYCNKEIFISSQYAIFFIINTL